MSRRLHHYTMAVLAAAIQPCSQWGSPEPETSDPYTPRARSKGEKARNRKARGGRA